MYLVSIWFIKVQIKTILLTIGAFYLSIFLFLGIFYIIWHNI